MIGSSPSDLAVAFRSLARRHDEVAAAAGGEPARVSAASGALHALDRTVTEAAGLLHVPAQGDLAAAGRAVAEAIESRPADAWAEPELDRLRELALEAGRHLREAQAAVDTAG